MESLSLLLILKADILYVKILGHEYLVFTSFCQLFVIYVLVGNHFVLKTFEFHADNFGFWKTLLRSLKVLDLFLFQVRYDDALW